MEYCIVRVVSVGGILGGVVGVVVGSVVVGKRFERKNMVFKENWGNIIFSMGQCVGLKVGVVLDMKNKVKDKVNVVKENIKDMFIQIVYVVYFVKEKVKFSVFDFKCGMVQEQQFRQMGCLEKQEQYKKSIVVKCMEF